jgi:hypothetical protein
MDLTLGAPGPGAQEFHAHRMITNFRKKYELSTYVFYEHNIHAYINMDLFVL